MIDYNDEDDAALQQAVLLSLIDAEKEHKNEKPFIEASSTVSSKILQEDKQINRKKRKREEFEEDSIVSDDDLKKAIALSLRQEERKSHEGMEKSKKKRRIEEEKITITVEDDDEDEMIREAIRISLLEQKSIPTSSGHSLDLKAMEGVFTTNKLMMGLSSAGVTIEELIERVTECFISRSIMVSSPNTSNFLSNINRTSFNQRL